MRVLRMLLFAAALVAIVLAAERAEPPGWLGGGGDPGGALPPDATGPCRLAFVYDGDTALLRCAGEELKVRLLRIDTPERDEPGHAEATRALRALLEGRDVHLVYETPGEAVRDRYARVLAYLFADGRNVNVELVRAGHTSYDTRFGTGRFEAAFRAAERGAAR